ncbi:hypothetical protein V1512DRAFT_249365 [Lipomyces arxii]|uniref:uncharacterized protein n=1 Tax=Lipomyces arxii TaxID=56418 RepID=UPI0034CE1DD5
MELQVQDETLRKALDLLLSMRQLNDSTFKVLYQLSEFTEKAASSLPSPPSVPSATLDQKLENEESTEQSQVEAMQVDDRQKDPTEVAAEIEFASGCKVLIGRMIYLRSLNRQYQVDSKHEKEVIAGQRAELDRLQLELQNVLYRQKYIRQEIGLCQDYKALHESIDFVPLEEFYRDHREHLGDKKLDEKADEREVNEENREQVNEENREQVNEENREQANEVEMQDVLPDSGLAEHKLMLARLSDEQDRRLKLVLEKSELTKKRAVLIAENMRRKEDLESLDGQLQRFIESATPIQSVFDKY